MADNFYATYPVTGGGVSSINTLTGALFLVGGTGITITPSGGDTLTIASTSAGDVTLTPFGSSPNANAASLSGQALTLQPASASFPGGVSTTTQSFAGSKTFVNLLNADGGIDRSTSGTLTIGATNSTIINIGNSGATVNIQGTTIYENTPQLLVADPLITVNTGGGVGSGQNSGIEINENNVITGYFETSSDRNSWILKAPNTAGVVTITPGASGFTIDQGSHDPVTLTAFGSSPNANGASLTGQALTLQPADGTNPGGVSTGTQTFGGNKTFTGTISASNFSGTSSGTNTGDVTLTAVGSSPNANAASLLGQALTLQPADGTNPGVLTSGTQTIGGNKTFTGTISASNFSGASSGTNTGDVTLTAFGTTPNANGASLLGQALTLQPADATNPGGVSTGTQTFAGNKTFTGTISASNFSGSSSGTNTGDVTIGTANGLSLVGQVLSLALSSTSTTGALSSTDWNTFNNKQPAGNYITDLTGDATATGPGSVALTLATVNGNVGTFGTATQVGTFTVNAKGLITAASNTTIAIPFSQVSGTVPIAQGGTGQTTKAAAFDALSPMTTLGDIIYENATPSGVRLAGNTTATKLFLTQTGNGTISAAPGWNAIVAGDVPTLNQNTTGTASNVTGVVAIANGGTGQTTANAGFNALSPLTTKGDILTYTTVNARQPVGTNGQVLTADSTQTSGIKWATPTSGSVTSFFRAYKGANQTITAGTPAEIIFGNVVTDVGGNFSAASGRFTAPTTGYYIFTANISFTAGATAPTDVTIKFLKNNTTPNLGVWFEDIFAVLKTYTAVITDPIALTSGDTVSVTVACSTNNITVNGTGGTSENSSFGGYFIGS